MTMINNRKIKIAVLVAVLMSASVLTLAITKTHLFAASAPAKPVDTARKELVYDRALLARFEEMSKRYAAIQQNYTLAGVINTANKADTSTQMKNISFFCCKQGDELYYKLGTTETINANGLYLYIDHLAKTVLMSGQKSLQASQTPQAFTNIAATLKGEDYSLSSNTRGSNETISLINEHHITCKQYSISFDTLSKNINRIYMRLSDGQDPLDKRKEQIVDVSVSQWLNTASLERYAPKNAIVKEVAGEWKLTDKYAGYQLIKM